MLAALFNSRAAFHREWKRYKNSATGNEGIAGRWTGQWISQRSNHQGELRCVLTPVSPDVYRACFYASFSLLFRVAYVTNLKTESMDGRVLLKGEEDLGALAGGTYRCEGEVIGSEFNCQYSCKYDHGIFRLKRVD
jgi:hypothetical protein